MHTNILIFRTSITSKRDIKRVAALLQKNPQIRKWNVDLEDWENVLRIESHGVTAEDISTSLLNVGIYAKELD